MMNNLINNIKNKYYNFMIKYHRDERERCHQNGLIIKVISHDLAMQRYENKLIK